MFRRAGRPVTELDRRTHAQRRLIDIHVTVAPAPEQAELVAAVVAVEADIDLRAALLVVHLLRLGHHTVELVVGVVQPLVVVEGVGGQATALVQRAIEGLAVELEARFDLVVHAFFGAGIADLVVQYRVGQLVLATQAGGEGVLFLGPVAHALVDRILRHAGKSILVGAGGDHVGAVEVEDHALAGFGIVELAVQRAQVVTAVLVRAPVEIEVGADALALDLVLAVLQVQRGDFARAGGGRILVPADITVLHFAVVRFERPLLVVHAGGDAEGVVEHFAVVESGLRAGLARKLLVAAFDLATQAAALAVERRGGLDQDRAANGVARHVRGR